MFHYTGGVKDCRKDWLIAKYYLFSPGPQIGIFCYLRHTNCEADLEALSIVIEGSEALH